MTADRTPTPIDFTLTEQEIRIILLWCLAASTDELLPEEIALKMKLEAALQREQKL